MNRRVVFSALTDAVRTIFIIFYKTLWRRRNSCIQLSFGVNKSKQPSVLHFIYDFRQSRGLMKSFFFFFVNSITHHTLLQELQGIYSYAIYGIEM